MFSFKFLLEFIVGARGTIYLLGNMIKILLEFIKIVDNIGLLWQKVLKNSHLYVYSGLYSYYFWENFPPILLFSPICLLAFQKKSHLYFYCEPSSIRNSRVHTFWQNRRCRRRRRHAILLHTCITTCPPVLGSE